MYIYIYVIRIRALGFWGFGGLGFGVRDSWRLWGSGFRALWFTGLGLRCRFMRGLTRRIVYTRGVT